MAKIVKSFRFTQNVLNMIKDFKTDNKNAALNNKLEFIIEAITVLINKTKKELKDMFSVEEALLLVISIKDVKQNFEITQKALLLKSVWDAIVVLDLDKKYNIDKTKFLKKLEGLTEFQCFVVIYMCYEYWSQIQDTECDVHHKILKNTFNIIDNI